MPYVGHLKADRTWGQDVSDLFDTIQKVKEERRNREIGQRMMQIIAGGGGQPEIAGELSRKPEGRGGIPGMLDVFNPMTAARGTSPLEDALRMEIMKTGLDPLAGLRREQLEAGIGLTKARKKALEEPEIKPPKTIDVYDPDKDATFIWKFDSKLGEFVDTGMITKKPTAKWGQIQKAGTDEVLPEGSLYQTNEAGEIKPVRWPQEAKPPNMIKIQDETGATFYHKFNPKTRAYEKTDMMAEGPEETEIEKMMQQGLSREDATEAYRIKVGLETRAGRGKTFDIKQINEYLRELQGWGTKELDENSHFVIEQMLQGTGYKLKETKTTTTIDRQWPIPNETKTMSKWIIVKGDTGEEVSTKVKMKAPDGKTYEVDSSEVAESEKHGWTRL